jgi:uncharacterized membrane protein
MFPLVTEWAGENHTASVPTALYGAVLFLAAVAYWVLQRVIIAAQGPQSLLQRAVGRDLKGKISPILYALGIGAAFWATWLAQAVYLLVALMWLIPDRRIEHALVSSRS